MKKFLLSTFFLGIVSVLVISCSKDDKLVGTWSYIYGLGNPYTDSRCFSEDGPGQTFIHSLEFQKGNGAKGSFIDKVRPLILGSSSDQKMLIGSSISGEWEVKGNKLYLYYNDDMELLNANALYDEEKSQVARQWSNHFEEWKKKGEEGYSFEIIEKNGKTGLNISGLRTPHFIKEKEE